LDTKDKIHQSGFCFTVKGRTRCL